jgi:hypothetical protein
MERDCTEDVRMVGWEEVTRDETVALATSIDPVL